MEMIGELGSLFVAVKPVADRLIQNSSLPSVLSPVVQALPLLTQSFSAAVQVELQTIDDLLVDNINI